MKENNYIREVPGESPAQAFVNEVAVANCQALNMRSSPNKNSSIVTVVTEGTRLKVEKQPEASDQWIKVSTEDKKPMTGFVMRKYVRVI